MNLESFRSEFDRKIMLEAEKCGCVGCMAMCCAREGLWERETDRLYQRYLTGDTIDDLVKETCGVLTSIRNGYQEEVETFLHDAKERLVLHVEMGEKEEGYPSRQFYDMRIRYRILMKNGKNVIVNKGLCEQYALTDDQLHDCAVANSERLYPVKITPLDHGMYMAQARGMDHGAGVMFYPSFLREAQKWMMGGYYILPSSVHEVLLLPEKRRPKGMDLDALVKKVNHACVNVKERLSSLAFHVEKETLKMLSVREYDEKERCPFVI